MSDESPDSCSFDPSCRQDVREIRAAVFGNGHPEKSLLVRMERVESRLAAIHRMSFATLCAVGTLALKIIGTWVEVLLRGL